MYAVATTALASRHTDYRVSNPRAAQQRGRLEPHLGDLLARHPECGDTAAGADRRPSASSTILRIVIARSTAPSARNNRCAA